MREYKIRQVNDQFFGEEWEYPEDGTCPMLCCTIVKPGTHLRYFDSREEAQEAIDEYERRRVKDETRTS